MICQGILITPSRLGRRLKPNVSMLSLVTCDSVAVPHPRGVNVLVFTYNSKLCSHIFNIHVLNVDPQIKRSGRVYVDPAGEKISGGRIKAEKMKSADAFRRYG